MRPWLVFSAALLGSVVVASVLWVTVPVPDAVLVGAVAAIGASAFAWARHRATADPVEGRFVGFSDAFEVTLPVQRTAVGRGVQVRLLGETRRVWAPGLLGLTHRAGAFVPAREKHQPRAWGGDIDRYEIGPILGSSSFLRLHTPEGPMQFAVDLPAGQLEQRVGPLLRPQQATLAADPEPPPRRTHAAAEVDPTTGTNLQVLTDPPQDPRPGDIFALAPPGEMFLVGRVVATDAQWTRAERRGSAVLIYIYAEWFTRRELPDPALLGPDQLLVPPILTNLIPWRSGVFERVGNRPAGPGDLLDPHCFRSPSTGAYFDGFGRELPGPVGPVGILALHSVRTIDDEISDALGIPRTS